MANYSVVGNAVYFIQLSVLVLYAAAVIGHAMEWWRLDIFGSNWASEGFCLSFKGSLVHTHLLCLYVDTACAAGLLWLSRRCGHRTELYVVKENVASVFAHGLVHGLLWANGPLPERPQYESPSIVSFAVVALFFFSFTYLMTPSPLWLGALQSIAHTVVLTRIPWILSFTYVNTVIGFNLSAAQIATSPRDVYYVLYPLLYAGPVLLATLLEPLLCDDFLVKWGGHLFFDISIPFGTVLYYIVASRLPPREDRSEMKKSL
ncbi:unnamed protein product [Ectocarpus fasciculatus]